MKIAMIGHKRIPGREGGVEVVVEELSVRMAQLGHKVVVYNRNKKNQKEKNKQYKKVKIINIPTIEKKSTDAVIYSFLASIHALFCKYDVIHYHALGPSVMLLIPHLFHIRTIVTVHGLNYKTPKWKGLGARFIHLGEVITAKYADEVIVLSRNQQAYFKEKYNRNTKYIPNGTTINQKLGANIIKKKWNLSKDGYILFLSRIVPGKGLEHLIEAYKKIETNLPLIIAGESTYTDEFYTNIYEMAKGDSRIKFVGFVEGKELIELYSNTALYVFPSEAEGMPMCLLEALSYGAKCLVSDIPENLEVGKEYVQTFKVSNVNDLQKQLKKIIDSPNNEFQDGCEEYIEKNFEWQNIVDKTINCYKEVL